MKILTTFTDLGTVTASGSDANFPVANVEDLDPGIRWRADAYAGDVWIKADMGSAKALTALFLNRCNFAHCHVQGHASDDWGSPSFDQGVDLAQDEAGNRKAWADLAAFNFRWLRILIPGGQSLDSGTVPEVGNVIVGASTSLPYVGQFEAELVGRVDRFEADGGGLVRTPRGLQRHILRVEFGDTLTNVKAVLKTWTHAVFFDDLGSAAGAWLVTRPDTWGRPVRSVLDASVRVTLEERP